jgi:anti-sigma factor ChrR (cupin superfamily)
MKPTDNDERKVLNIHEAEFTPWVLENGEIHPSSTLQHDTSKPNGVGFHVYKMEPGSTTTPHRHTANEEFLILSGELIENDGTVYREGDLIWLKEGTEHSSYTETGCLMAVYIETPEQNL